MSHLIMPEDLTFSVTNGEWHGLARSPLANPDATEQEKIEAMPQAIRENLDFEIVEGSIAGVIAGEPSAVIDGIEGHKLIIADCRKLPVHAGREKHPNDFIYLGKPTDSYSSLSIGKALEILIAAFTALGVDLRIVTAGTLGKLTRFYITCDLSHVASIKTPDGHSILPNLSFLSSHDGSLIWHVLDSLIRIVCNNTLQASLSGMSGFRLSGKHTANGLASLDNLGEMLEAYVTGCQLFSNDLERLANQSVDLISSREIVAGYFFSDALTNGVKISDSIKLTPQAMRTTEGIVMLARHGNGNLGESQMDLLNGATDYWSNGEGTGSEKVGLRKRVSMAMFGAASEHKTNFTKYLLNDALVTDARKVAKTALLNTAN